MDNKWGHYEKLEALETWFYRKMLIILWKDMLTNEEVYRRMNTHKSLLGHIIRKNDLEGLVAIAL